ncbi:hypothetical protein [Chryseolinea lacunae]|uniref:CHASE2 domain-containing protein n=1 Tax=Chryseolinea lacunae TaxID=2801331 RepID=A0ABS1KNF1_9BACT|nr:hypothetical protein [Chryseolinea lacunae]MBL0740758.1 hypothetical protein [Chryseolinea lacunae]
MKRYVLPLLFALVIVVAYHFIRINLFRLDLCKNTRENIFYFRILPEVDPDIILLNTGKLESAEIKIGIDSLLKFNPRVIGVNLCHLSSEDQEISRHYSDNKKVVFVHCEADPHGGNLSEIIEDQNVVTHFNSDRTDYFEFQLTGFKGRGNKKEIINYRGASTHYIAGELSDLFPINAENISEKMILLGYMGDYLTDSVQYFKSCRITPLNRYYGESNILPDMYDTVITANIISSINHHEFINEIGEIARIGLLLTCTLINVLAITYIKTKWPAVNVVIAAIIFIAMMGAGSFLIVYFFTKGYYLNLDELPMLLLVATIFTVVLNIREKQIKPTEHNQLKKNNP